MSADEKLDRFVRGLRQPLRREVELKEPATIDEAVKLAEKLDSTQRSVPSSSSSAYSSRTHRPKYDSDGPTPMDLNAMPDRAPNRGRHQQSGGQRPQHNRAQSPGQQRQFTRLTPELRSKLMQEGKCLYCREPGHIAVNCPKRSSQGNGRRPPTPGQRR